MKKAPDSKWACALLKANRLPQFHSGGVHGPLTRLNGRQTSLAAAIIGKSIGGGTFHQACLVGFQVIGHGFDAADLGADALQAKLFGYPVVDQLLAQRYNLNICSLRLPNLALGQWQPIMRFYFHPGIRQ
jgi:hypothetical protein